MMRVLCCIYSLPLPQILVDSRRAKVLRKLLFALSQPSMRQPIWDIKVWRGMKECGRACRSVGRAGSSAALSKTAALGLMGRACCCIEQPAE